MIRKNHTKLDPFLQILICSAPSQMARMPRLISRQVSSSAVPSSDSALNWNKYHRGEVRVWVQKDVFDFSNFLKPLVSPPLCPRILLPLRWFVAKIVQIGSKLVWRWFQLYTPAILTQWKHPTKDQTRWTFLSRDKEFTSMHNTYLAPIIHVSSHTFHTLKWTGGPVHTDWQKMLSRWHSTSNLNEMFF